MLPYCRWEDQWNSWLCIKWPSPTMAETFFANSQSDATYIDIQLDFNIQIVVDLLASYDEIAKPMMNPSLHSVAACCVPIRLPQQTHRFFTGKIPTLVHTILIACHHLYPQSWKILGNKNQQTQPNPRSHYTIYILYIIYIYYTPIMVDSCWFYNH